MGKLTLSMAMASGLKAVRVITREWMILPREKVRALADVSMKAFLLYTCSLHPGIATSLD